MPDQPTSVPGWGGLKFYGLCLMAVFLLVYLLALIDVVRVSREDQRRPVEVIAVLGAAQYNGRPSPVLRARLDHAHALYASGLAGHIVVTGGTATGDTVSEAVVGERYLRSLGVPDAVTAALPAGHSTEASIAALARWLKEHRLGAVILVSDPFHLCRLRLEARRAGLEAYTSPTLSSPIAKNSRQEWLYFAAEAFKVPVTWARRLAD